MSIWTQLAIACPLLFLAGFIDSIAGGGGLISLPAFFMAGLPSHMAVGTNKLAVSGGTLMSTWQYLKNGYVCRKIVPLSVVSALVGAFLGARLNLFMDEVVLRWIMIVLVPIIAIFTVLKKDFLNAEPQELPLKPMMIRTFVVAFSIGMYDGFFGPGAGSFLLLAFVGALKLDPVTASGNAKVVNLSSNIASVITFAISGNIVVVLALVSGAFSIVGNYMGSKLAMNRGVKIIKPMMLVVVGLLLIKLVQDLVLAANGNL